MLEKLLKFEKKKQCCDSSGWIWAYNSLNECFTLLKMKYFASQTVSSIVLYVIIFMILYYFS